MPHLLVTEKTLMYSVQANLSGNVMISYLLLLSRIVHVPLYKNIALLDTFVLENQINHGTTIHVCC